jgi:hypothetical protein
MTKGSDLLVAALENEGVEPQASPHFCGWEGYILMHET